MRIIHCAETIKGGIATYLRDLLPLQIASYGERNVIVIIPKSQASDLDIPKGVVCYVYADSSMRMVNVLLLTLKIIQLTRDIRDTIIHLHSTFAGLSRLVLQILCRNARLIYCAHGWAWDRTSKSYIRHAIICCERFLSYFCEKIICISRHEYQSAVTAKIMQSKLVLIPNGISEKSPPASRRKYHWKRGRKRLLFVGRFDRQKGVDVFLRALELLGDKVHAMIAGDKVLNERTTAVEYPENATALGWLPQNELTTLYKDADVLIVPSRWEGFGLVAVEAMREGTAVIATRVGGLQDIVEDGKSGVLISPDDPVAIASAVERYTVSEFKRFGKYGYTRFFMMYSINRVHRDICIEYEHALSRV